jgi:hypothetical protein
MTAIELQDDVIKTDEDTTKEDSGDSGGLYSYEPTQADIYIREEHQTIFGLLRKYDNSKLIIEPYLQRNVVLELDKKVNLLNLSS